jgi:hypothetical protein
MPAGFNPYDAVSAAQATGRVLNASGTLAYPFVTTPKVPYDLYTDAMPTSPVPGTTYSSVLVNANGYMVGFDTYPFNDGILQRYVGGPFYAQRNSDGTFGPIKSFGFDWTDRYDPAGSYGMKIIDLNAKDQVLGITLNGVPGLGMYDLHSGTWTSIYSDIQLFHGFNIVGTPLALDDQGRILATGGSPETVMQPDDHLLLLTPDGVSSDPVPVPEPSTFVILGVGVASVGLWGRAVRAGHRTVAGTRPRTPSRTR